MDNLINSQLNVLCESQNKSNESIMICCVDNQNTFFCQSSKIYEIIKVDKSFNYLFELAKKEHYKNKKPKNH